MKKQTKIHNSADLRAMLLEAIDGVRTGKVDHRQAQAISALSSRVLQSARLELDMARAASTSVALMGPTPLNNGQPSLVRTKRK